MNIEKIRCYAGLTGIQDLAERDAPRGKLHIGGFIHDDGAFAAKALFEETYPDVKVYVDYEIPYFIVSAGNCLTKEEAIMLKGRVSATFPKAFLKQLKREKSPISNLLDQ